MKVQVRARIWDVRLGTSIEKELADMMGFDQVEDKTTESFQALLRWSCLRKLHPFFCHLLNTPKLC